MKTDLLHTNKEGKEVVSNIHAISIMQAAIQLASEIDKLGEARVLKAANNTWTPQTGKYFLKIIKDVQNDFLLTFNLGCENE